MSYSHESSASSESAAIDADFGEVGGVPVLFIYVLSGLGLFLIGLIGIVYYCAKKEAKEEEQKLANAPTVPPPMDYQNQRKC